MSLFQDELSEDEGPALYQFESEECFGGQPFQDEADEPEPVAARPQQSTPALFQDECSEPDDASESGSGASGSLADVEEEHHKSYQHLVQLDFAVMTKFLGMQRSKEESAPGRPVKKRRYDNSRRAAEAKAAAMKKMNKGPPKETRLARNSSEAWSVFGTLCWVYYMFVGQVMNHPCLNLDHKSVRKG